MKSLIFAAVALGLSGPVMAQDLAQPPLGAAPPVATSPQTAAPSPPTDAEIQRIGPLSVEVGKIAYSAEPKLLAAVRDSDKAQVQAEIDAAMKSAITGAGFTVARYNEIFRMAREDTALNNRISATISAPTGTAVNASGVEPEPK